MTDKPMYNNALQFGLVPFELLHGGLVLVLDEAQKRTRAGKLALIFEVALGIVAISPFILFGMMFSLVTFGIGVIALYWHIMDLILTKFCELVDSVRSKTAQKMEPRLETAGEVYARKVYKESVIDELEE